MNARVGARTPVAVVTGGSSGIGAATARWLAAEGYAVTVVGRRPEPLDATVDAIEEAGGFADAFAADVRDENRIAELAEHVGAHGGLDVLVNSAGGQFRSPARDLTPNGWRAVVETNLTGTFLVTHALYPLLRERGGSVVNLVANIWQGAAPGMAHSGAARAGVVSLTRTLALEWAPDGIRVNAVSPGLTRTEGLAGYGDALDRLAADVPLGRIAEVDEVVDAIAYLVGAGYVTGEVLTIDGGLALR